MSQSNGKEIDGPDIINLILIKQVLENTLQCRVNRKNKGKHGNTHHLHLPGAAAQFF